MPERWEIYQSVPEEENLGARVYPKSIEVYPRRMKKAYVGLLVREEESWSPLSRSQARAPGPV